MENTMENKNSLAERFQLVGSQVSESRYIRKAGSTIYLSKSDESYLSSMTVYECTNSSTGETYKALKVMFNKDGKSVELSPWPTLDLSSSSRFEHMDSIDPMLVRFYIQVDTQTGKEYNKVHIIDINNTKEYEKAVKVWESRTV